MLHHASSIHLKVLLLSPVQQPEKFYKEILPVWVGYFEKFLADGRTWLLGSSFSVADIALFNWFSEFHAAHPECFAAGPHVVALVARVAQRPNIQQYLSARPVTEW